jgi:inosine-uridine nucleoside N-ribohydrolase
VLDVIWDMETGDPDDFVTLLLLLGHPRVRLLGVTITPGTPDQVGVVRRALEWFDRKIPVGAFDIEHRPPTQTKRLCVSPWHYEAYGEVPASRDAVPGPDLLHELCGPGTTLVTGGPLRNLGRAIQKPGFRLGRLFVQGGFAGEGVVPRERQLEKFRGLTTCPTYNLNGDPASALAVLACPAIAAKRFVSKNVCHGVHYDQALHSRLAPLRDRSRSLDLIWRGMEVLLARSHPRPRNAAITSPTVRLAGHVKKIELLSRTDALARAAAKGLDLVVVNDEEPPVCRLLPGESEDAAGKKLHDPLAACCAIDESIGEWAEVELYREKGKWGARPSPGSGVKIITAHDHEKFVATLTAH